MSWKTKLLKYGILAWITYANIVPWGVFDSPRTREVARWSNANNLVKTVTAVEEEHGVALVTASCWQLTYTNTVTFDDNSTISLQYRDHWIQRIIHGEMFQPKLGECYEVTKSGRLVRKVD